MPYIRYYYVLNSAIIMHAMFIAYPRFLRWLKTAPDQRGLILQCLLSVDASALALGTAWPRLQEALLASLGMIMKL